MNLRIQLSLTTALALLASPAAAAPPDTWKGWEHVGTRDGIATYKRAVPGSKLLDFGGETVIDRDVETLCSVLTDYDRYPQWVDSLTEIGVLKREGPRTVQYYQVFDLPWPMSDREFVSRQRLIVDAKSQTLTVRDEPIEHPSRPLDGCCTRATIQIGEVRLRPAGPGKTAVVAIARVDMGGMLPAWFVNFVQEEFPQNTFVGYRRQLARDVRLVPQCRGLLEVGATATATTAAAPAAP